MSKPKPDPAADDAKPDAPQCPTGPAGPVREAGGTTGAGNLSPQGASRTGGATGGVDPADQGNPRAGTIPPDPPKTR